MTTVVRPVLNPAEDPVTRRLALDVGPLPGFEQAAERVLDYLASAYDLGLWMVTRTCGEDWVVLHCVGDAYPVGPGDVFAWSDSFCSRMVRGEGPRVAPRAMTVPAYAAAPIARRLQIGAYVGIPLVGPDGDLFGSLCGIDPEPHPASLTAALPLFELQARLLSSLLAKELTATGLARSALVAEQSPCLDPVTGLLNRKGWDRVLAAEQERCSRYASPASVIALDLDGLRAGHTRLGHPAGDALLRTAGEILRTAGRASDVAARTGDAEFAVLCVETPESMAQTVATRLQERLQRHGIEASCGVAGLDPRDGDLAAAWQQADTARYLDKRLRAPA